MKRHRQGAGLHKVSLLAMIKKDIAGGLCRTYFLPADLWYFLKVKGVLPIPNDCNVRASLDSDLDHDRFYIETYDDAKDEAEEGSDRPVDYLTIRSGETY